MIMRIAIAFVLTAVPLIAHAHWDEQMAIAYCTIEERFDWLTDLCKRRGADPASIAAAEKAVHQWRELHSEVLPKLRNYCRTSQHWQSSLSYFRQERDVVEQRLNGATQKDANAICSASAKSVFHPQYNVSQVVLVNPIPER
jgi:hypothetical protein